MARPYPYVGLMLRKSRFNPANGVADFWSEFRKPTPYRWPVLAFSALLSLGLLYAVTKERYYYPPERPTIEYITSFEPDRSDAEIMASNVENQRQQDELAAEREAIAERKRELYRSLGRATGMDVDEMERQIAEDREREEAELEQPQAEQAQRTTDNSAQ